MADALVLSVPFGQPDEIVQLLTTTQQPVQAKVSVLALLGAITSPVYVEPYITRNAGDFRTGVRDAWLSNPIASEFIYPAGDWRFVGAALTLADGYRNNCIHTGQNTYVYDDLGGVAGGQRIFFLRSDTGAGHADRIVWRGFRFGLLNALTSYFGSAIYMDSASNCSIYDCEAYCTLTGAATTGRIRWGFALFGGNAGDGGGRNNIVDRVRTTISQIQLCGQGRDVDGILCTNVESISNNDFIVSCVSLGAGASVRNVQIRGVVGHNVAGGGCVFAGNDGVGTGIGCDNVENLTIDGVSVDGAKDPDLDFVTASVVIVDLGINSRNVVVSNVNTVLASTELQCRSVLIQSQTDEVSSVGVSVSNLNLGIVTTNDPLEALFISGVNLNGVQISNVYVEGLRGVRIIDCDRVVCSNVNTTDGGFLVQAESRNLTCFTMANSNVQRLTGFNSALQFSSSASRNFGQVSLSNVTVKDNSGNGGLLYSSGAAAGATKFSLADCTWRGTNQPNAATQAAIFRAVNCIGLTIVSTVVVAVPAVAAGDVGYVAVAMAAGTRLADLAVNEGIQANPQAQLVAAGAGGGYINARVSAAGTVEFAFLGPLAGGNANFTVSRCAA